MEELKKSRKSYRQKITRIKTWIDRNFESEIDHYQFQLRGDELMNYFKHYDEIQTAIEEIDIDGRETEHRDEIESSYFNVLAKIKRKLSQLTASSGNVLTISVILNVTT
ncbi:hypothetical protein ABEB36_013852 [Hypothenemus hampei]|uniref:Uncharacterized protein n=1 Tax=Hypothenemus hampei TaxID=57062 RepID=A0ABD1E9Z5_HYPHA